MPAAAKKKISFSDIRKKVNTSLIIDSRSLYNKLSNFTDEFIKKNWHNVDIANLQSFSSYRLFKLFAANDSSFSSALYTHVRMMVDTFRATAYKPNESIFTEGQIYINSLLHKFNYEDKYSDGFTHPNTITDQIARIARNLLTSDNAAAALFIELNPTSYEVEDFKPIDCDRVYFEGQPFLFTDSTYISGSFGDGKKRRPYIFQNGHKVPVDVANFLWQPLDSDAEQINGNSPLRPALRHTFTKLEFLDNLRKVLKNQAWPKVKVVLDEEAVLNIAPPEIKHDQKKLIKFFNDYLAIIEDQLTNIAVDQNIVVYDTIKEISFLESKIRFDPRPIAALLDAEAISALKAPPSTVGKGGSTKTGEGLASAELVIFRRTVKALRTIVETLYSRAFTFALRMNGMQGYVKFRLKEFSLRPPEERAQFDSILVETLKTSWALGAIGDDELYRKIRQIHDLEGPPPEDASLRKDILMGSKTDLERQTERTPIANENKEKKRAETRKSQKTGNDKKSTKSNLQFYFEDFSIDKLDALDFSPDTFLSIKKDKVDWKKIYNEGNAHWVDDLQPSKFAQNFAKKMVDKNKKSVLEIGCGNGRDSILFALAKRKVIAIDIVPEAIKIAKANAEKAKVKIDFHVGTAENLEFKDNSFSALFALSVLHSTNIKKSMQEIYRVLKKDSIVFIYIYSNVEKIDGTKSSFISIDEFIDLVKKTGFEISDIYTSSEDEYDEAGEKHSIIVSELQK